MSDDTSPTALLSPRQAADFLGVKTRTLKTWRWRGSGPSYVRLGNKNGARIMYRLSDLEDWVGARVYRSTSDASSSDEA